ncbi:phage major capsid protein [Amycolatopsis sp. NPDC004772]
MSNAYLVALRAKYDKAAADIEAIQTRAVDEKRDLTEEELRSVTELGDAAKAVAEQIKPLLEIENRNAEVLAATANILPATQTATTEKPETRAATGTTYTQDRDPGHYRSEKEGGQHSFFGDHYRAQVRGDRESLQRLQEHSRAVVQSANAGIVPPRWLTDEYMATARQNRVVADLVRHLDLGTDPRPLVLGKQTAGTDQNITDQTAEGANNAGWGTDRYTSGSDTLTPTTKAAYQDISRQLLDSSTPAVDSLIYEDLHSAFDTVVEGLVCAAILAGGTAAGTTFANEAAFKANAAAIDAVIDGQMAVAADQRGVADLVVMNFRRFGAFRKLKDGNNRPLMPVSRYNPQNANGAVGNFLVGDIEGADAVGTAGVPTAYAEKYAVLRRNAVILAESPISDFTYEQVGGPSNIRVGIWGYVGVLVRNPGSVSIQTVTAAT